MAQCNLMARINSRLIALSLFAIDKESFKENERPSDFICESLKVFGDAIRPEGSQPFWLGGKYLWFTDEHQQHVAGIWTTDNGILIYQEGDNLFRIVFD